MSLLHAAGVEHGYRRFPGRRVPSLRGVSLTVEPGQCWGLIGPNGSGKSTLLRLAAGLADPARGELRVQNVRAGQAAARAATGYVPESVRWPAALTVAGVLHELAAITGLSRSLQRVERAVAITGLASLLDRRLGTLSQGQARRVVLAQAFLDEPPLLLLDEPFSGLDSLVILDVREHLSQRLAQGAGIVLASHRIDDFTGLATHVLVLRDGLVVRSGPADEVLADAQGRAALTGLLGAAP
jgi:ABC-type multidrug transport system ATPase subunit